jgi:hypothetical protein
MRITRKYLDELATRTQTKLGRPEWTIQSAGNGKLHLYERCNPQGGVNTIITGTNSELESYMYGCQLGAELTIKKLEDEGLIKDIYDNAELRR